MTQPKSASTSRSLPSHRGKPWSSIEIAKFWAVAPLKARSRKPLSEPPSLVEENGLNARGYHLIAGVDEAGRGALAGPVVAAAVILPQSPDFPWLQSVRASKDARPAGRQALFDLIKQEAIAVSVGIIAPQTIDVVG